jgi:hypothetical protein
MKGYSNLDPRSRSHHVQQHQSGFFQYLRSLRFHHFLIFFLIALLLFAFIIHWALNNVRLTRDFLFFHLKRKATGMTIDYWITLQVMSDQYDTGSFSSRYKMDAAILDDPNYLEAADLRSRIQDMWSIKGK